MKRAVASWIFLLALLGCSKLLPHDAGALPIVDPDYQFRLAVPGPGWRLLPEKEMRRLLPDAVAGASESGHGLTDRYGAVIVESYSGDKPRQLAELLVSNMPVEDRQLVSMVDTVFEKEPAVRYQVTGKINGVALRYLNTVFFHQGHAYQVLSWGLAGQADEKALLTFANAFHLLAGPVRDRTKVSKVTDERGVGWRVQGGVFQSASYGLTLRPTGGWQLAVGDELARMNDGAEVGMVHGGPEAYLVLIPEPLNGTSAAAFGKSALARNAAALGVEPVAGPPWSAVVAGQTVQFARFRHPKQPLEYLLGVIFHGDVAYLTMAWYEVSFSDKGQSLLQTGLAGIEFLGEPARQAVSRELLALPDGQAAIGASYALRRGVYRDFEQGLTWRKPPGPLRILAGAAARQHNKDATLVFEQPEAGLHGLLIAETAQVEAGAYHQAATRKLVPPGPRGRRLRPLAVPLGGLPGLSTTVEHELNGVVLKQQLVSAAGDGHAYQVTLWGRPAAMASGGEWARAVLAGFKFGALAPLFWEGETLTDQRMGFGFRPPAALGAGWHHKDVTPDEIRPLGTMMKWEDGRYAVTVIAIHALERGQDEDWFLDQVRQHGHGLSALLSSDKETADRLGGEPARRVSLKQLGQLHGELLLLSRDRTFYALAVDAVTGALAPAITDSIKAEFRFLE